MYDYEEACPVSKAASVLCERWTLQIIREMFMGASRFSELQTYLPAMSPTLLNNRLKQLQQQGIVVRCKIPEKKGYEYQLSAAGKALLPVLQEMGRWGMTYAYDSMKPAELNAAVLVRDFAVSLDLSQMPAGDITLQFNVETEEGVARKFVMLRGGKAQVCDENLGMDVNLYLSASLETLGKIWYGEVSVSQACATKHLQVVGDHYLQQRVSKWLGVSQFAPFNTRAVKGC